MGDRPAHATGDRERTESDEELEAEIRNEWAEEEKASERTGRRTGSSRTWLPNSGRGGHLGGENGHTILKCDKETSMVAVRDASCWEAESFPRTHRKASAYRAEGSRRRGRQSEASPAQ